MKPGPNAVRIPLYVVKDRIIIPTLGQTEGGPFREVEPITSLRIDDPKLAEVLGDAVRRGNPNVEMLSRMNIPRAVVLKYAGVKSWPAFVKIAERWELVAEKGTYTLARGTKGFKGSYLGGGANIPIPSEPEGTLPDTKAIIDLIRSGTVAK